MEFKNFSDLDLHNLIWRYELENREGVMLKKLYFTHLGKGIIFLYPKTISYHRHPPKTHFLLVTTFPSAYKARIFLLVDLRVFFQIQGRGDRKKAKKL